MTGERLACSECGVGPCKYEHPIGTLKINFDKCTVPKIEPIFQVDIDTAFSQIPVVEVEEIQRYE